MSTWRFKTEDWLQIHAHLSHRGQDKRRHWQLQNRQMPRQRLHSESRWVAFGISWSCKVRICQLDASGSTSLFLLKRSSLMKRKTLLRQTCTCGSPGCWPMGSQSSVAFCDVDTFTAIQQPLIGIRILSNLKMSTSLVHRATQS